MKETKLAIGLFIGFAVAGLGIYFLEEFAKSFFEEFNHRPYQQKDLNDFMRGVPFKAFSYIILARLSAIFTGTLIACKISGWNRYIPSIVIGVIMTALMYIDTMSAYNPTWYKACMIGLTMPTALLAQKIYLTIVTEPL